MTDEPVGTEPAPEPAPAPVQKGRRYRRHSIALADGGKLVLGVHGTIDRIDDQGATTQSWTPDDPEWPGQAIRFGLHPDAPTVAPDGSRVKGNRPPG